MLRAQARRRRRQPGQPPGRHRETRTLGASVAEVDLSGPDQPDPAPGADASLEVRGEQRLLANVDTTVDGDMLHIGPRGILLRHRQPIEVTGHAAHARTLSINGSGQHTRQRLLGRRIDVNSTDPAAALQRPLPRDRRRPARQRRHGTHRRQCDTRGRRPQGSGRMTLVGGDPRAARGARAAPATSTPATCAPPRPTWPPGLRHQRRLCQQARAREMSGSGDITCLRQSGQARRQPHGSGERQLRGLSRD
jgi:hypothetical protein